MTSFNKVTVLGSGAFGIALAKMAANTSSRVFLWSRNETTCTAINTLHHHETRLSEITLSSSIYALTNLEEALYQAEVVIIAVPVAALSSVLANAKAFFSKETIVVSTSKGIAEEGLALPVDIINEVLPKHLSKRACYLSGPSFAVELARGLPTALTLASLDENAAAYVQNGFVQSNFRLYRTLDIIGVLVGGAFKNVIAIAAGACVSLGLGRNALAALITRGLFELTRLSVKMGGRAETLSGLAGAGDLILSCTDSLSRNHRLGAFLAEGMDLPKALASIAGVVEGVSTAKSIPQLVKKYHIELPIAESVFRVLYQGEEVRAAMDTLLSRKLKEETFS